MRNLFDTKWALRFDEGEVNIRCISNTEAACFSLLVKLRHLDPLQDVRMHVAADNLSVTLSWKKPYAAVRRSVVEWFPEGHTMELRWVGLGRNENHTVITGGY